MQVRNVTLGRPAGAGCRNPARPAAPWPGEGVEEGLGAREGRFMHLAGPVAAPGVGRGGDLCRRALQHWRQ
jgi:hypothetical protein